MTYTPLPLDLGAPANVQAFVAGRLDEIFEEAHHVLRLPDPGPKGPVLLATNAITSIIGGISTTLYSPTSGTDSDKFVGVLSDHYPWGEEPAAAMTGEPAAEVLYEVYRCNFAHTLGLDTHKVGQRTEFSGTAYPIKVSKGFPLDDAKMKDLEGTDRPDWLPPTLMQQPGKLVLRVDALYWGVRRMVDALTSDHAARTVADQFLGDTGYSEIATSATGEFKIIYEPLK